MGHLRKPDGHLVLLPARTLIGRAPTAGLLLEDRRVSAEHASIFYDTGWWVRDLGSSNGTWVGPRRLSAGERAPLAAGETVAFGDPAAPFVLTDEAPPGPMAQSPSGAWVVGADGLLALPDDANPKVSIFPRDEGWVAEAGDGVRIVEHGSVVLVDQRPFTLSLPTPVEGTWSASGTPWVLNESTLICQVSRDYETVRLTLTGPAGQLALGTRAHHVLLAALAAQRQADASLAVAEQGWTFMEEIEQRLGVGAHLINVHVYRARKQLGQAEVQGAAGIIERRAGTGQLRLGMRRIVLQGAMPA